MTIHPLCHGLAKWLQSHMGPICLVVIILLLAGVPLLLPPRAIVEHYHENLLAVVHLTVDIVGLAAIVFVFLSRTLKETNGGGTSKPPQHPANSQTSA